MSHAKNDNFPERRLARHCLIELTDCPEAAISRTTSVERAMREAARRAGATIVKSEFHQFAPYGVSGVVIIQESHLTVHTWPEYGYAAVDLFTCSEEMDIEAAVAYLARAFSAGARWSRQIDRGLPGGQSREINQ